MCLVTDWKEPKIAEKDIVCYKWYMTRYDDTYVSPYQGSPIPMFKVVTHTELDTPKILNDTGILNFFSLKNASGILMSCVLGGMFISFIVVGILSFKASRKDKKDAEIEKDNTIKVMEWLKDNAPAQLIEESYAGDGLSEEMKYFERSDFLKKSIKNEFPDFSDDYIQDVTDQYIDELFN